MRYSILPGRLLTLLSPSTDIPLTEYLERLVLGNEVTRILHRLQQLRHQRRCKIIDKCVIGYTFVRECQLNHIFLPVSIPSASVFILLCSLEVAKIHILDEGIEAKAEGCETCAHKD